MRSDSVHVVADVAAPIKNAIVGGPFGSNLVSKDYVESGIPVIRGQNMVHGRWIGGDFVYVTEEKAESLSGNLARPGDLVFTQRGTLGQVAIVPDEPHQKYLVSQSQMKLTADSDLAEPMYLYYEFTSPRQLEYIRTNTIQAGVPHTNLGILRNTPLDLPTLGTQRAIVRILSTLDDKIDLNRRMNQTLEAMAQAIFQSWFVGFDPVKAKIAATAHGRDPERAAMAALAGKLAVPKDLTTISGEELDAADAELNQLNDEQRNQLAETAGLFPSELVESELGLIPQEWGVGKLADIVKLLSGGTPKKSESEYWNGDILWFTVRDSPTESDIFILDTGNKITERGLAESSTRILPMGTSIISARGTVGKLAMVGLPMAMNQSCYGVIGINGVTPYFNYFNLLHAVTMLKQNTHGAVFDTITRATFNIIDQVIPPNYLISNYEKLASPILETIRTNGQNSVTLAQLRDTLLPKLLSGELAVSVAEDKIEEVIA